MQQVDKKVLKGVKYWVDVSGNAWECSKYSFDRASACSKSMIDCFYCINSELCTGSTNLKGCRLMSNSDNCVGCERGDRVVDCEDCTDCYFVRGGVGKSGVSFACFDEVEHSEQYLTPVVGHTAPLNKLLLRDYKGTPEDFVAWSSKCAEEERYGYRKG